MKKCNSIDVTKFIMAIAVIAIHTHPLENFSNPCWITLYDNFVNLAVPFFFISSGFFLGKKIWQASDHAEQLDIILKYLIRFTKLYVLWSVIYLPLAIYEYSIKNFSFLKSFILYFRNLFFIGEHYNSWTLWYLLSTIYTLLFIYILSLRKVTPKIIFSVCILFGLIVRSGCNWLVSSTNVPPPVHMLTKLVHLTIGNGRILSGFLYIPLGISIARRTPSLFTSVSCLFTGFAFLTFAPSSLSSLCLALYATGFFCTILYINLKDRSIFRLLRSLSTSLYFTHMWIWSLYYFYRFGEKTYGLECFTLTTIICIIIGLLYFDFASYFHKVKALNKT